MSGDYPYGQHRVTCPSCSRGPRDRSAGLRVDDGGSVIHCFRCGHIESSQKKRPAIPRSPTVKTAPEQHIILNDWGCALWASTLELSGEARAYLEARHCRIPPPDSDLRWHPSLKHPSGYVGPALVALLTDSMDYRVKRSLHRTWVCGDGTKAPIDTPRLLLAGHAKAGAVCRLWPDEAVTMGLGVAEGIETALSLAHAFCPVWATVDASGLAALPVLAGVESLTIGADNDPAGIKAATTCADRWAAAGREVRIVKPREHKKDLNDLAVTA